MSLRHIERLPIPYVSNCTSEYPADFQFYDFGYAESFCQVECRSLYINRTCGCWHPYIIPAQVNISLYYDVKSKIYLWMELKLVPIAFSLIFNLLLQDGVQQQWLLRSSSVFVLEHLPARISFTAIVPRRVTIQTSRLSVFCRKAQVMNFNSLFRLLRQRFWVGNENNWIITKVNRS